MSQTPFRIERLHEELADVRADAALLRAEIERLTVRVNDQNADYKKLEDDNASCLRITTELRFDNEQLRAALADAIAWHEAERGNELGESPRIDGWRRALEPKP